jgi:hypothetical protein
LVVDPLEVDEQRDPKAAMDRLRSLFAAETGNDDDSDDGDIQALMIFVRHLNDAREDMRSELPIHKNEIHELLKTDFRPAVRKEALRRTREEMGPDEWSRYRNRVARESRKPVPTPDWYEPLPPGAFRPDWVTQSPTDSLGSVTPSNRPQRRRR